MSKKRKKTKKAKVFKVHKMKMNNTPQKDVSSVVGVHKEDRYSLPIREIKLDLVKIVVFAIFAVASLIVLKATGFTFRF